MAKRTTRSRTPRISDTYAPGMEPLNDQAADTGARNSRNGSVESQPSEEEIRKRAYRRYVERGGGDGGDFDDWLEAERELKGS